jgi:hypothetical protein
MRTKLTFVTLFIFGIVLTTDTHCFAQTQIVTLAVSTNGPVNYALTTNQIVRIISLTGDALQIGTNNQTPFIWLYHSSGVVIASQSPGTYTGLTNITLTSSYATTVNGVTTVVSTPGLLSFAITTPSTSLVVSNYVPADAIVIPASATGNVQIILESSPDLVNWTAAEPGIYGASSATNRFFRVRAEVGP